MRTRLIPFFLLAAFILIVQNAHAADLGFSVTPSKRSYAPGDTVMLSLDVYIPSGFQLYGNPLGPGIGKPVKLDTRGGTGIIWIFLRKLPAVKTVQDEQNWVWAYSTVTHFFFKGVVAIGTKPGVIKGDLLIDGLVCKESCTPIRQAIPFSVSVGESSPETHFAANRRLSRLLAKTQPLDFEPVPGASSEIVAALAKMKVPESMRGGNVVADAGLPQASAPWKYSAVEKVSGMNIVIALLLAFLAGIILNAMPCVLPVLGIKLLSFVKEAKHDRRSALMHSLYFAAGMMAVFIVLASLAVFAQFSWGQQFQNPFMMMTIICIIFVFSLGMFDVFSILTPPVSSGSEAGMGHGYAGDFLRGMFTTVLATPCSGPFLGGTLAWTLTQPPVVIYIVFIALGAGMAFPYVLLSANRSIARFVPKPGPWMVDFKRLMGFLMLGFAIYLLFGLPRDMHLVCAGICLSLALAVMAYGRFAPFGASRRRRLICGAAALVIAGTGTYLNIGIVYNSTSEQAAAKAREDTEGLKWLPFDPKELIAVNARGEDAVVDFTANWCMNCQYNTVSVLNSKPVRELLEKKKVHAFLVDMTGPNPAGEALLQDLGSRSIPFFAIFPGGDPRHPIIMRDILNKGDVVRELSRLKDE